MAHAPNCACCTGPVAGAQSLDEVAFDKSACAAAQNGDCGRLQVLLARNPRLVADDGRRSSSGYTPLHYAARANRLQAAELLLDCGADPNAATASGGATPLHRAAYMGHVAMTRLLLAHGADAAARDADGSTPLDKAAQQGHGEVAQLLASSLQGRPQ